MGRVVENAREREREVEGEGEGEGEEGAEAGGASCLHYL